MDFDEPGQAANSKQINQHRLHEAQINKALGTFLLAFALVVLIAILFTPTGIGKLTNLAAGGIIALIAGVMLWRAHRLSNPQ